MLKRKYLTICMFLLLDSVLIGSLFINTITQAQTEGHQAQEPIGTTSLPYDAWYDLNMDGYINIVDVVAVAIRFGTSGDPKRNIPPPSYDSGWLNISQNQTLTLTHNLGTTELLVYVIGNHSQTKIHQIHYGGEFKGYPVPDKYGVNFSYLTNTTIDVYRYVDDRWWDQVRVMIWKIQPIP